MGCVYSRSCIGHSCVPRIKHVENVKTSEIGVFSPTHCGEDYDDDQVRDLNQLSFGRDTEAGVKRLSRVSAQFLPPDGYRTIRVPSENYELRCSFLSQRGYYPDALDKANQDSFCIHTPFGTDPNDHFFGVFDGHGEFGAECSQFVKHKLCENLLRNSRFHSDPIEACHTAFLTTNSQLHADSLDDSMSGTTAITVLVRGRSIYVANTGDSRAVIAQRKGSDIVAVDLSIDQTPFRTDEIERVKQCGARVLTLDQIEGLKNPDVQCWGTEEGDDGDPPRLWVQNGMYPGTAFTRSLGDSIAESIGVVPNPEIVSFELTPEYPFFVIASDGVFEFISSQTVVDMVAKFKDPRDACAAIVAESYRLWLQYETRTDDITIIVVHINGLYNDVRGTSSPGPVMSPIPQVLESTGSESPATMALNSRNQRVRHDVSRARLRAIESSLESGNAWVPPSSSHRKTWEEEAHIERALHDHFLFRKLTDSQCHVLLDCMQRIEVQAGDIVVEQGGEGDCFFVVGSGEFDVFATQEENNGKVPRVLQRYTADKLSCFGELALMYNKPLQASVRCVTSGTLWALKREDFRGILVSEFSNMSSLKLLRSVDLLSRLTILQLSQIATSLSEVSFSDRQLVVSQHECLHALYIIQKGKVVIEFDADVLKNPNIYSLKSDSEGENDDIQSNNKRLIVEKSEGSYFGEWAVLGEEVNQITISAIGDVICSVLTKEQFDSVVGPLTRISQDSQKLKDLSVDIKKDPEQTVGPVVPQNAQLSDLEWRRGLYNTDCSEIGLVLLKGSENIFSLKRFSKQKVKILGKEAQVLHEKSLMRSLGSSACIPQILCTCADETHAGILLNTPLACPLASILCKPLDELSARFCAASVVIALEELQLKGVLYRGVSPDMLMFDQAGGLQFVDFRFGKKLDGERTFTICGMADSLAPEIVLGKGHGLSADWWSLGVLIYFMLQGDMPFGSWRENEVDTSARIAKGQFNLPQSCTPEALDIITKLLEVDETKRLGSDGPESVKRHPWFAGFDWTAFVNRAIVVPTEIVTRVRHHLQNCPEDYSFPPSSPLQDSEGLNSVEWLEDW